VAVENAAPMLSCADDELDLNHLERRRGLGSSCSTPVAPDRAFADAASAR
jgi:hypothetical protein